MITAFTVKNFKAIGEEPVRIELKPITLLFGANSAGKSSILHALNYAYSVFVDHNLNAEYNTHNDSVFNLESFHRFVHKKKKNNNILIRFDINFKLEQHDCHNLLLSYSDESFYYFDGQYGKDAYDIFGIIDRKKIVLQTAYVELEISWDHIKNCPYVFRYETGFNEEQLATIYADGYNNKVAVRFFNKEHKLYKELVDGGFSIDWLLNHEIPLSQKDALPNFERGLYPEKNIWCNVNQLVDRGFFKDGFFKENKIPYDFESDFLDRKMSEFENFIAAFLILPGRLVTKCLESTMYLGPLREIPSRHFLGEVSEDNSESRWRWEKGLGAWDLIYQIGQLQLDQSKKSIEDISVWMEENFEEHYDEILSIISHHPICRVDFREYLINTNRLLKDRLKSYEKDDKLDYYQNLLIKKNLEKLIKKGNVKKYISNLPIETLISLDLPGKNSRELADKLCDKINHWLASDQCLSTGYKVYIEKFRKISSDLFDKDKSPEELLKEILNKPETTQTWLHDISRDINLKPHEIGTGISQVLPVVIAAVALDASLIAIEQPELHIHPALQVRLGDLFIEQIEDRKIFLIETHSEHLILRLMRRIREGKIKPKDINVIFAESTGQGSRFIKLRLDEDGDFIDEWPGGFFEESFHEKFAGR